MMKVRNLAASLTFAALASFIIIESPASATAQASQNGPASRPRLVVICVFDQMREEYLDRYQPVFGEGGFRRIQQNGVRYVNCDYPYASTETGPGHASIGSGRLPRNHGIIANEWWGPRRAENGREYVGRVYCTDDLAFAQKVVTTSGAGEAWAAATTNFRGENLTDRVKAEIPGSKVYAVSFKDRAALYTGGAAADAALWFAVDATDPNSPLKNTFISSTKYFPQTLPSWIRDFMTKQLENIPETVNISIPESVVNNPAICTADDVPWEGGPGLRHKFPYALRKDNKINWDAVSSAPPALPILTDFAFEWIDRAQLGADDATDVLWVSFSSTDYCGHSFGPDSVELADMYQHADAQVKRLLDRLDAIIKGRNYVFAITSDHGVCAVQENNKTPRALGGRFLVFEPDDRVEIEMELCRRMKVEYDKKHTLISRVLDSGWYLNRERIAKEKMDYKECVDALRETLKKHPGVLSTYTRAEIEDSRTISTDTFGRQIYNSFDPARSGDLIVLLKPNWVHLGAGGRYVATHGTPYRYDTHVPMLLYGSGIARGRVVADAVSPLDLVPTISTILQINPPKDCDGRVLPGALQPGAGGAR